MNFCAPLPFDLPVASLWQAFAQSNLMGQSIVLLQIVMSVVVWSIMVGKRQELKAMETVARRFRKVFDGAHEALDIFFQQRKSDNPMAVVYQASCEKLLTTFSPEARMDLAAKRGSAAGCALTAREITLVKGVTEQALAEQIVRIERGMNMLATGATAAPLVGLLGTVWGLLDAFQSMSGKGSALLTDVAPGISSAMLTTVVGLLVAIPSGIGYNALLGRVRNLTIALDGFVDELLGRISCEYQGRES
ncbi:MAG: MotA/TolQ/ExbB proton channel family protein [Kiritimatiellae bacterium]|nr:MotA/TolQ/ExbB proton channel family protein [Kiritimatiellia bacterium]